MVCVNFKFIKQFSPIFTISRNCFFNPKPFPMKRKILICYFPPPPIKKPNPCGANAFCLTAYRMGSVTVSNNNINGVYPNPNHRNFRGYILNESSRTQINIFDIRGKLIFTTLATYRMPGYYTENINIGNNPNGVYLLEFLKNGLKTTYKLLNN